MRQRTVTAHEVEILLLSARYGMAEAAKEKGIGYQTVKTTLSGLYTKLDARGMAHAVLILAEKGEPL